MGTRNRGKCHLRGALLGDGRVATCNIGLGPNRGVCKYRKCLFFGGHALGDSGVVSTSCFRKFRCASQGVVHCTRILLLTTRTGLRTNGASMTLGSVGRVHVHTGRAPLADIALSSVGARGHLRLYLRDAQFRSLMH